MNDDSESHDMDDAYEAMKDIIAIAFDHMTFEQQYEVTEQFGTEFIADTMEDAVNSLKDEGNPQEQQEYTLNHYPFKLGKDSTDEVTINVPRGMRLVLESRW
jgi:hypothetical protein